jgi:hypothetical protein
MFNCSALFTSYSTVFHSRYTRHDVRLYFLGYSSPSPDHCPPALLFSTPLVASLVPNMSEQSNQFMTDEYVLAYHGPLLYEARVSHFTITYQSSRIFQAIPSHPSSYTPASTLTFYSRSSCQRIGQRPIPSWARSDRTTLSTTKDGSKREFTFYSLHNAVMLAYADDM